MVGIVSIIGHRFISGLKPEIRQMVRYEEAENFAVALKIALRRERSLEVEEPSASTSASMVVNNPNPLPPNVLNWQAPIYAPPVATMAPPIPMQVPTSVPHQIHSPFVPVLNHPPTYAPPPVPNPTPLPIIPKLHPSISLM